MTDDEYAESLRLWREHERAAAHRLRDIQHMIRKLERWRKGADMRKKIEIMDMIALAVIALWLALVILQSW